MIAREGYARPVRWHAMSAGILVMLMLVLRATQTCAALPATTRPSTFHNPLKRAGADPWMTCFRGEYYLTTTTGRDIRMRKARSIGGLNDAEDVVVWREASPPPERATALWAAEFHRFDAGDGRGFRWYGYYTAAKARDEPSHRMFVIESAGDDPMGPYAFKAKLRTDADDKWYAIDGHPFVNDADGRMYFAWCGRPSAAGQGLYLAKMKSPWELDGPRVYLEASGFGQNVPVREGPVTLQRGGRVLLVYSAASADTPDYKLGLLIADATADLLNPTSWKQHPAPLLQRNDVNGIYGPGHNFFFKSPDGTQDWIVYHAKSTASTSYRDRTTRVQPFTWTAEGIPDFGQCWPTTREINEPSGTAGG